MGMLSFLQKKEEPQADIGSEIPPPPPPPTPLQSNIYSELPDLEKKPEKNQSLGDLPTLDPSGPNKMFSSPDVGLGDLPPAPKKMPPLRIIHDPIAPMPQKMAPLPPAPMKHPAQSFGPVEPPAAAITPIEHQLPINQGPQTIHLPPIRVVSFHPKREIPEPAPPKPQKIVFPEGEHFILATKFRSVLEGIDQISLKISKVEDALGKTNVPDILQKQDEEFRKYQRILDEVQRKMGVIDALLFESTR